MNTDTTDDPKRVADAEPATIPLAATRTRLPSVSSPPGLESRVAARRAEIIARLVEIKADAQIEAVEARGKLKAKLSELGHIIKESVVDGRANLGELATHRLEHWLAN